MAVRLENEFFWPPSATGFLLVGLWLVAAPQICFVLDLVGLGGFVFLFSFWLSSPSRLASWWFSRSPARCMFASMVFDGFLLCCFCFFLFLFFVFVTGSC